jgi:hypothetical protein
MSILNTEIKFIAKSFEEGRAVTYSYGVQRVIACLKHQNSWYVLVEDRSEKSIYINRLKSVLRVDLYVSENFEKIEDDAEWFAIYNLLKEAGINL